MRLNAVLNEFVYECTIKKYTSATIKGYRNGNGLFIKWLNDTHGITELEEVRTVCVKEYIFTKINNNCKETYINGIIKQLRAFFKYAVECDYIASDPMLKVKWTKENKPLIKTFTDEEARKLSAVFMNTTYTETRNRTIMLMLLDTGIRCSELCMLKERSLNGNILTIKGKGNKERQVGISPILQRQLLIYFRIKQAYVSDKEIHSDALFLSRTCRQCTPNTIENIVKTAGIRAELNSDIRCSPHTCRHFYAQNLVRNGVDVYSLSRLLGHENISITQRYLNSMLDADIVTKSITASPLMNL
ncbi:integrase/recombinase XerD [Ruminococcus sp. YE71]|uniref:tyrosine-type recombinase/integrase n=1 Tax=unclassified Ruminococcus TaxID=2608920 RepID=UPI00087FCA25|nr:MULTISPECIES: tyrosine-type recombinase/integrase [unclassified Ruminococcus]SDA29295.1 integrase/recombinase XerD [Ruminococcus sp. YE78]SFW47946.1 integrase/recombinase XerD [Ruminococcus sp. YE71]